MTARPTPCGDEPEPEARTTLGLPRVSVPASHGGARGGSDEQESRPGASRFPGQMSLRHVPSSSEASLLWPFATVGRHVSRTMRCLLGRTRWLRTRVFPLPRQLPDFICLRKTDLAPRLQQYTRHRSALQPDFRRDEDLDQRGFCRNGAFPGRSGGRTGQREEEAEPRRELPRSSPTLKSSRARSSYGRVFKSSRA